MEGGIKKLSEALKSLGIEPSPSSHGKAQFPEISGN